VDGLGFGDGGGVLPELVPLAGGHSGETFLAQSMGERSVVRIYAGRGATRGPNAAEIDAAVLRLVRGLLPVPEVLEVRRADDSAGTPALLVTSWLEGTRLDEVLSTADEAMAEKIGHNLGEILARLAQMPMLRAGRFLDGDLRIGPWPPGADDLAEWVATYGRTGQLSEWGEDDRSALEALAEKAQEVVDRTERACLVHSDFNPKNLLVEAATGEVTGLLDWEYAHAGSPFADLGNLLRFDRRPVFADAVLSTYANLVVDAPDDLLERARAADLFALVELASRAGQNAVADRAHDQLLAMARAGDLHATAPG
jgi:aminoglycoside phosphotransferase (APT) family kinase protein